MAQKSYKIVSDPIHGQIILHPLCVEIIDTPEFQRLRRLKQLGLTYTVYPSAINDRFSHSLGVSHLSRKFLDELVNNSRGLKINGTPIEKVIEEKEILCIEIAGLCHDLGHGPFSHVWEAFMKEVAKERNETNMWMHEEASLHMLDYLIKRNNLANKFEEYNVKVDDIKYLIKGQSIQGKPKFMSQIVNNSDSGLDVDKWDYYLRDCYHLGMQCNFEYERLIRFAKVKKVNDDYIICFRDKVKPMVYSMFRTRNELHHAAYQHKMVKLMEKMMCDALVKLDKENKKPLNLWKTTKETIAEDKDTRDQALERFCELTDDVIYNKLKKRNSTVIDCIERRRKNKDCYQFICQWNHKESEEEGFKKIKLDMQTIQESIKNGIISNGANISEDKLIVQIVTIHWGKMSENPVKSVYFYSKDDEVILDTNEESTKWMHPILFEDVLVRILCKTCEETTCKNIREGCDKYKKSIGIN